MKTLRLKLTDHQKPTVVYIMEPEDIFIMLDTGASFPVWCRAVSILLACYPDAVKETYLAYLSGFGGKGGLRDVYRIPKFYIIGENGRLCINNFIVIVEPNINISQTLILGASVFDGKIDYSVHTRGKIRELVLEYDKDEYYMSVIKCAHVRNGKLSDNELDKVYIWADEERSDNLTRGDQDESGPNIQNESKPAIDALNELKW